MREWIDVNERLPKVYDEALITDGKNISIGYVVSVDDRKYVLNGEVGNLREWIGIWLIYDTYKDRKIDRELQEVKRSFVDHPTEKGGGGKLKVYNLKISDMASVENLTKALLVNGYEIQLSAVQKEFPYRGVEYYKISIFDSQIEKGGATDTNVGGKEKGGVQG